MKTVLKAYCVYTRDDISGSHILYETLSEASKFARECCEAVVKDKRICNVRVVEMPVELYINSSGQAKVGYGPSRLVYKFVPNVSWKEVASGSI